MLDINNDNINLKNFFLSQSIFSLMDNDMFSNVPLIDRKKTPPTKVPKFILKKQGTPQVNLLQKKTTIKQRYFDAYRDNPNNGRWTNEEQYQFAEAVLKYGNDWKNIQNHISSRNITQVRSHAQKFLLKLKESNFLKGKGLAQNLCWTKTIHFLKDNLNYEELKYVLFSVEQTGHKRNNKNLKDNKNQQNQNSIEGEDNMTSDLGQENYNKKYKNIKEEE